MRTAVIPAIVGGCGGCRRLPVICGGGGFWAVSICMSQLSNWIDRVGEDCSGLQGDLEGRFEFRSFIPK